MLRFGSGDLLDKKEKRAAIRLYLPLEGKSTQEIRGREFEQIVVIKDISACGAYSLTNTHPFIGEKATLRLRGSFNQAKISFEVVGTVVRVDQLSENICGFAVRFEKVSRGHPHSPHS